MFTLNRTKAKKYLVLFMGIIMFSASIRVEAHGGGGCGCCGQDTLYSYGSYFNYPVYYQSAGRNGFALGTSYPGYSYYYPAYTTAYSAYPVALNIALPSAYSSLYNLNQPYQSGNPFISSLWGNTGYSYPIGQVTTNDYTVEQSRTTYVPGGEVTTTVSKGTEISTVPPYNPLLSTLYNNPYALGAGTWTTLAGFGAY